MTGWEKYVNALRQHMGIYHVVCILLCAGIFYSMMVGVTLPVKKLGKSLGTPAAVLGGFCLAYYLLRELLVRAKKAAWNLQPDLETLWKQVLKILRLLHPLLGVLAAYLVCLHGGLLLLAGSSLRSSRMAAGLMEACLVLFLLLTGHWLMKYRSLRCWHRWIAWLIVIVFLVHVYVKFRF